MVKELPKYTDKEYRQQCRQNEKRKREWKIKRGIDRQTNIVKSERWGLQVKWRENKQKIENEK